MLLVELVDRLGYLLVEDGVDSVPLLLLPEIALRLLQELSLEPERLVRGQMS